MGERFVRFVKVHAAASAVVKAPLLTLRAGTDAGRLSGFPPQIKPKSEGDQGGGDEDDGHEVLGSPVHRDVYRCGVETGYVELVPGEALPRASDPPGVSCDRRRSFSLSPTDAGW